MPTKKFTQAEADDIELRYKQLLIEEMMEKSQARADRKEQLAADRAQQIADFLKNEKERLRRQLVCKHRKGGKDNKFANGNSQNFSVIMNTYPTGDQCVMCTRCGKEVWKPKRSLRKENPELYQEQWRLWVEWRDFPTDNSPSGGQIFDIQSSAA
jgi:hypothetical protein